MALLFFVAIFNSLGNYFLFSAKLCPAPVFFENLSRHQPHALTIAFQSGTFPDGASPSGYGKAKHVKALGKLVPTVTVLLFMPSS